jgi:hypothetical protein
VSAVLFMPIVYMCVYTQVHQSDSIIYLSFTSTTDKQTIDDDVLGC